MQLPKHPEMPELCHEKRHRLHADDNGRRSTQRDEDSTRARPLPASISTTSLGFTVDTPSKPWNQGLSQRKRHAEDPDRRTR